MSDPITVFLLDDHEIVRRGVRHLLEGESDIKVVGEASTEAEAIGRVHALTRTSPSSTSGSRKATASSHAARSGHSILVPPASS